MYFESVYYTYWFILVLFFPLQYFVNFHIRVIPIYMSNYKISCYVSPLFVFTKRLGGLFYPPLYFWFCINLVQFLFLLFTRINSETMWKWNFCMTVVFNKHVISLIDIGVLRIFCLFYELLVSIFYQKTYSFHHKFSNLLA